MNNTDVLDYEVMIFSNPNKIDYIWNKIKHNDVLLYNAIKVVERKCQGEMVEQFNAPIIAELILADRHNVNDKVFRSTLDIIYSNISIARTIGHISNTTYLLKTFFDDKLKISKMQKQFAVKEAIEAYTTTSYNNNIIPAHQANGFDLREYILLNSNWTDEEKKELVYKFYTFDSVYVNKLQKLIYSVYNSRINYIDNGSGKKVNSLDFNRFFYYSLEELTNYYGNKSVAEEMYKRIRTLESLMMTSPSIYLDELEQKKLMKK